MTAVANGVALHVLDIGRVETSLVAIRAALDASMWIERELMQTREHMKKLDEQHAQDLEEHANEIVARMASTFGVRNLLKTAERSEENNPIGVFIKRRREALSLLSQHLLRGWA